MILNLVGTIYFIEYSLWSHGKLKYKDLPKNYNLLAENILFLIHLEIK